MWDKNISHRPPLGSILGCNNLSTYHSKNFVSLYGVKTVDCTIREYVPSFTRIMSHKNFFRQNRIARGVIYKLNIII